VQFFPKETVIVPQVSPDLTRLQSSPIIISHQFPFEKTTVILTLSINVSVHEGAREQNPAKFPVETVVDRAGDCDDKSLLLAGLLSREGCPVALLLFGPESHMAEGVGSDDYVYKNTGCAFVETTNYSFIGVPTDKLGGILTLYSDPVIIPIRNGTKFYGSGSETRYIHDMYVLSDLKVKELEPQLKSRESDLTYQQEKITQLKS